MELRSHDIESALRQLGVRVTQARRSVFDALQRSEEPMSAAQIRTALQEENVSMDLVTVYRTLDTLERCGLIARTDRLDDGWRYAVRTKAHHHSITCARCGSMAPLANCELERLESTLEHSTGYSDIRHSLQFFGTCPQCQP